jgi:hypothetical protein
LTCETEPDYIGMMRETMEEWYSKPRNGWHVTDVALCPRQRVFKRIDPLPITNKELNVYSSGRGIHEAVQRLFMSNPGRFEKEKYVEHSKIVGSIDLFDKHRNTPLEFKTLRSSKIDEPKSFQEEQLRYYMAMQNSPTGYMIYQCLMNFGEDAWRQFKVTMTEQQMKEQLEKLVIEIQSLKFAMENNDPSLVRGVYSDEGLNWMCNDCPYAKECIEMRTAGAAA